MDETACKQGLRRLKAYRKEWDERRAVWRNHPYHGPESNGADAYLTFANSNHTPEAAPIYGGDRHKKRFYDREDENDSWLTA